MKGGWGGRGGWQDPTYTLRRQAYWWCGNGTEEDHGRPGDQSEGRRCSRMWDAGRLGEGCHFWMNRALKRKWYWTAKPLGEALCVQGIEDEQTFSRQRRCVFKVPNPACRALGPWQLPGVQQGEWAAVRRISPLHRLPTDRVPLVSELTQHVIQLQVVVSQGGLLLQRTPSPVGGVVDRMLGSEGFLKLLYIQQESSMHFYLGLIHK